MSSNRKCKNCGSTDIEEDNTRGDTVCTYCGTVLDDTIIVNDVQYDESGGTSRSIGQFVSADAGMGATSFGYGKFHFGINTESREVTIKKSKVAITLLCHQLKLNNHHIETSLNFFKMALMRHLTRGRKSSVVIAACVYMTCRTEGTSHLLIDISDVLQICCYELGKTYVKITNALCINIPSIDPCIYVMRFANQLQLKDKMNEVSLTALRIVQRMKKDSIHLGRRPTGVCGAALLIASRMHGFTRDVSDIVKIVKLNETTIKKRLLEFADTPSSSLTLDEFMSVDLEAEQDPPSFKNARKKDKERLLKLQQKELTKLQIEIENRLQKGVPRIVKSLLTDDNSNDAIDEFLINSNMSTIQECLEDDPNVMIPKEEIIQGLRPDVAAMCEVTKYKENTKTEFDYNDNGELYFDDLDDEEINGYVMSDVEFKNKNEMWTTLNADYIKEAEAREEKLKKEKLEGKPEKKKRSSRKIHITPSNTVDEALSKMLQKKKFSNKINYDILKTLTETNLDNSEEKSEDCKELNLILNDEKSKITLATSILGNCNKRAKLSTSKLSVFERIQETKSEDIFEDIDKNEEETEIETELEQDVEPQVEPECSSIKDLLYSRDDEDPYYGYDEEIY